MSGFADARHGLQHHGKRYVKDIPPVHLRDGGGKSRADVIADQHRFIGSPSSRRRASRLCLNDGVAAH